uniref:Eukaryotic translation initiation factor 4B n=1 Tax=Zonotrichia albicollis TaxID=44394 RepID=A0A8D2M8T9_ZONAL
MDRGFGSRDRYDDRSRDYDRGYDSRIGSGRRAFGSGYRRDDDYRGYEDRYDRRDDRMDRWNSRDDYGRDDFRREDRGPTQRPKLNLKPRSAPKEEETSAAPAAQSSRAASIFGGAKPVDTAAREREVEERLQKEQEKLQRQLEDDKRIDRRPRERHPSWRSEENQERSRTGSESSQSATRRRESEKSLENEPLGKEEEPPSPPPKSREEKPKVMPAPPPKENAWMKRSSQNPPGNSQSSDSEQASPTRWVFQEGVAWGVLFQPKAFHGSLLFPSGGPQGLGDEGDDEEGLPREPPEIPKNPNLDPGETEIKPKTHQFPQLQLLKSRQKKPHHEPMGTTPKSTRGAGGVIPSVFLKEKPPSLCFTWNKG